ncbi:PREDICTED: uncharacterized protein LOC104810250 [Tarenaya hassleriana]|uniref:uncharacterized protein LOC104810250 n=1 Tax=Tarenaya hassleriana TaxID=28532 RepID=UPI00053C2A22|nr:PREDICTED: uncharacterized protein LOC104810250 [Tarenaya hassleriana]
MVSLDGQLKVESVMKLHAKVRENIARRTEQYARQANQGRKKITTNEGDWVWLYLRHERFPNKRTSKLAPRGDHPFRVIEKINSNTYRLELPGEYNVSSTFSIAYLLPFDAEDSVLRSKPSQGGGDDEVIDLNRLNEEQAEQGNHGTHKGAEEHKGAKEEDKQGETTNEPVFPIISDPPLTRERARSLRSRINKFVAKTLEDNPRTEEACGLSNKSLLVFELLLSNT